MKKIVFLSLSIAFTGVAALTAFKSPYTVYGNSNRNNQSANYIDLNKAKEIAFADLNVKEDQVSYLRTEFNYDDGIAEYEVDFTYNSAEYDYEIDALSGTINEFSKELIGRYSANTSTTITVAQAKEIALNYLNLKAGDVTFLKEKSDYDDGRLEYEIELVSANKKYDFEILSDGTIRQYDFKIVSEQYNNTSTGSTQTNGISLEAATEIALKHSGLTAGQVVITKSKTDYDDGRKEYEIEFIYNRAEYEYTIDAETGTILEFDRD